jgi:nitrogen fixation/metabolism regulation signal transduction histidine kinase
VNRSIRNRLIVVFLAATLVPLAATWWIATALLEHSLSFQSTDQIDELSKTLGRAGREIYQYARDSLRRDVAAGRLQPERYPEAQLDAWPQSLREFWESGEAERFSLSEDGATVSYFVRGDGEVRAYTAPGRLSMGALSDQYRRARSTVERARERDLRRGLMTTFAVLAAGIWGVSLAVLMFLAHRVSRPIQQLTAGLSRLAAGDLSTRLETRRDDEIGRAISAFNDMAAQLQHSRERLVYLTQLASWQALARKMAHELKNSLTPIRLTMEEMLARQGENDPAFIQQAARIVVDEVESLERRVRAFSQFASEPPLRPAVVGVNGVIEERIALLKTGHPEVAYRLELDAGGPSAFADEDLVKGILTNLLENAAEAAGAGGRVLATTAAAAGQVIVEVHDSGPGLSEEARKSLFEPTISFKKRGMGLGLSIARKNALLSGGDVLLVDGLLGGAGFRVLLPQRSSNGAGTA